MLGALKITFPKFADVIDAKIHEKDSMDDFEIAVNKKAKELFVKDGHFIEHFMHPGSDHYKYVKRARSILRGIDIHIEG